MEKLSKEFNGIEIRPEDVEVGDSNMKGQKPEFAGDEFAPAAVPAPAAVAVAPHDGGEGEGEASIDDRIGVLSALAAHPLFGEGVIDNPVVMLEGSMRQNLEALQKAVSGGEGEGLSDEHRNALGSVRDQLSASIGQADHEGLANLHDALVINRGILLGILA